MRRFRIGIAAAAVLSVLAPAQEPAKADARPKELRALDAEFKAEGEKYGDAMKALIASDEYKKAAAAKDQEALTKLRGGVKAPDRDAYADKAWALAESLKGDDRARCLIWSAGIFAAPAKTERAMDALFKEFVKSPVMIELCETGGFQYVGVRNDGAAMEPRLKALAEDGATPLIKAWALYADSIRLGRKKPQSDEDKDLASALAAKAEKLAAGTELGDQIAAPRFEKERLQIGMVAPDIEGLDLDGKPMKLSDFRGKVVVLDFWGDW